MQFEAARNREIASRSRVRDIFREMKDGKSTKRIKFLDLFSLRIAFLNLTRTSRNAVTVF